MHWRASLVAGPEKCVQRQRAVAHRAIAARAGKQAAAIWLLAQREHIAWLPALWHGNCE